MNLVKHMSSNTTDRACLAYTRQSAFDKRQSLPRVSYTSTMKQIMGCYHLHIERTQTVRKNSSVGNDRPLSLICLLRSHSKHLLRIYGICREGENRGYYTLLSSKSHEKKVKPIVHTYVRGATAVYQHINNYSNTMLSHTNKAGAQYTSKEL